MNTYPGAPGLPQAETKEESMEQPNYTPKCCGQDAKWVEQSVNLKYFYCAKCKNEVTGGPGNADTTDALRYALANTPLFQPRQSLQLTSSPNPPPAAVYNPGDKVRIVTLNVSGEVVGKHGHLHLVRGDNNTMYQAYATDLVLDIKPILPLPGVKNNAFLLGHRVKRKVGGPTGTICGVPHNHTGYDVQFDGYHNIMRIDESELTLEP